MTHFHVQADNERLRNLSVGGVLVFPCDKSEHKVMPSNRSYPACLLRLRLNTYARLHGMRLHAVHFNGKLLVQRIE